MKRGFLGVLVVSAAVLVGTTVAAAACGRSVHVRISSPDEGALIRYAFDAPDVRHRATRVRTPVDFHTNGRELSGLVEVLEPGTVVSIEVWEKSRTRTQRVAASRTRSAAAISVSESRALVRSF